MSKDRTAASKALYRQLELVESDLAAAAHREVSNPPFKPGLATAHLREIRDTLAEFQWVRDE